MHLISDQTITAFNIINIPGPLIAEQHNFNFITTYYINDRMVFSLVTYAHQPANLGRSMTLGL